MVEQLGEQGPEFGPIVERGEVGVTGGVGWIGPAGSNRRAQSRHRLAGTMTSHGAVARDRQAHGEQEQAQQRVESRSREAAWRPPPRPSPTRGEGDCVLAR